MVAERMMTRGCQPSNLARGNKGRRLGVQTGPLGHCGKGVPSHNRIWDVGHLLKEASLVLLFIVRSKLDLALEACKFTGLVKGDRVGAIQDVISCLENTGGNSVWVQGYPC